MSSTSSVRVAEDSDVSIIVEFNQSMAMETENIELPEASVYHGVSAVIKDPNKGFYIVAEKGGHVKACLLITKEWSDWRNGFFWWIQSVYVEKTVRRQGLYKQMYNNVKKMVSEDSSVIGLRLYVEKNNDKAQAAYHKLGMNKTKYRLFEFMEQ